MHSKEASNNKLKESDSKFNQRKITLSCNNIDFCGPSVDLSLEFRCKNTSASRRQLCQEFWHKIDQDPALDRIMARGWSKDDDFVPPQKKTSLLPLPTPCEDLKEFIGRHVDSTALVNVKSGSNCRVDVDAEDLSLTDLDEFDRRVDTDHSAPPKIPRSLGLKIRKLSDSQESKE